MIHRKIIPIVLLGIIITLSLSVATAQQDNTITPVESGQYVSLTSNVGSVALHKIFGTVVFYDKGSTTNKIIDTYNVQVHKLNPNNGKWSPIAVNNMPCDIDYGWSENELGEKISLVECLRDSPNELFLVQYEISDVGIRAIAQYQNDHPQQNETHYFKLVETMSDSNFVTYDEGAELIIANGKILHPTSELRLLVKSNTSFDNGELITEFSTPSKLKNGYLIEIVRDFDY